MSEIVLKEAARGKAVDQMKPGDQVYIEASSVLADQANRVWIKNDAKTYMENDGQYCTRLAMTAKGATLDLSDCEQYEKMINISHKPSGSEESANGLTPVKEIQGVDRTGLWGTISRFTGLEPAAARIEHTNDGQALVPNKIKAGKIDDFKPGEYFYTDPISSIEGDTDKHAPWFKNFGFIEAKGNPGRYTCLRVDVKPDGVEVDGSLCYTRQRMGMPQFLPTIFKGHQTNESFKTDINAKPILKMTDVNLKMRD